MGGEKQIQETQHERVRAASLYTGDTESKYGNETGKTKTGEFDTKACEKECVKKRVRLEKTNN